MVIAIDGPGGVGKSTVSKGVARRMDLPYLDTGATYRAATVAVLEAGVDVDDEEAILLLLDRHVIDYSDEGILLSGRSVAAEVRTDEVTSNVSAVSAHPEVRRRIVEIQRNWVHRHGDTAVVEGRDIGTVVFPDTPVKVFLTARAEVRAARRAGDAEAAHISVEEIQDKLAIRDKKDSSRKASPMMAADDAVTVDTSDLTIDEVIQAIVDLATPFLDS